MSAEARLASGKGHRDENFPVASHLIAARHRPAIMAFYRFARAADDIADNAAAAESEKLALLESMRATLAGEASSSEPALALRLVCSARALSPQHGLDLLEAFRRDVTVRRYADWDALLDYCRYSAAPVGRFVLDVHGESPALWPANDALCAALQIINHLQDCGKDYRDLNRVYLPQDVLDAQGARIEQLALPAAPPPLRRAIVALADRTHDLLADARPFAAGIRARGLALEVAAIQRLAESLAHRLLSRDPLSERVHHSKPEALGLAATAVIRRLVS